MREIKFRAWGSETKEMIYFGLFEAGYFPKGEHDLHLIPKENIMQYTGLEDKNGQEIYEGDILRFGKRAHEKGCYCDHCWPDCPEGTIVLVVWISSGFQIIPPDAYPERDGICQECASYGGLLSPNHEMKIGYFAEVIGNVCENPDLIPKHLP